MHRISVRTHGIRSDNGKAWRIICPRKTACTCRVLFADNAEFSILSLHIAWLAAPRLEYTENNTPGCIREKRKSRPYLSLKEQQNFAPVHGRSGSGLPIKHPRQGTPHDPRHPASPAAPLRLQRTAPRSGSGDSASPRRGIGSRGLPHRRRQVALLVLRAADILGLCSFSYQ